MGSRAREITCAAETIQLTVIVQRVIDSIDELLDGGYGIKEVSMKACVWWRMQFKDVEEFPSARVCIPQTRWQI